jgi:hypothetical protein
MPFISLPGAQDIKLSPDIPRMALKPFHQLFMFVEGILGKG